MKIVITPAKRMNDNIDYIGVESLPVFLPQTEELLGILKTLKVDEVKKMMRMRRTLPSNNRRCSLV